MTKTFFNSILTLCVFLLAHFGYSQNSLEKEKVEFANAVDAEKIYLQLSGSTFNTSEIIWFKAVVTDVLNHEPTTRSSVLHVELIDPLDNQIVDKSLLKIQEGISHGFFQLHSSYREGNYIVRAYTEWNKNFGPEFVSTNPVRIYRLQNRDSRSDPIRDIVVTEDLPSARFFVSSSIDVKELDSLHMGDAKVYIHWKDGQDSLLIESEKIGSAATIQHTVPADVPVVNYLLKTKNEEFAKSIVLDKEFGTLRFFPEGGSLVAGLQSIVGFKYLDYRGKGAFVQGIIEDENHIKVTQFKSNALGMGKILLIPEAGKTYYGVLTTESGNTFKYKLPEAKKTGSVLGLVRNRAKWVLGIRSKDSTNDSLFVKVHHRGKNLFFLKARFKDGMFLHTFLSEKLPHGVVGLTVFNKQYQPVAERHFFNQLEEKSLEIKVETDREAYVMRDSVRVSISSKWAGRSKSASVSIMAVDSNYYFSTSQDRSTIVSYFLLQSDIKGRIENPNYYFKDDGKLAELDYLMLTQGWTNYKYKEKKKPRPYNAEKGLVIHGIVKNKTGSISNGPIDKKYTLNMLLLGEPPEAYVNDTDRKGQFSFTLSDSYGLGRKFVIQPTEKSSKNTELNIDILTHEPPEIDYKIEQILAPPDRFIQNRIVAKMEEDISLDPFLLPNTIALDEVEVSDYRITPERASMVELHGIPDVIIENEELIDKQENWTRMLYRWLLFNYPNDIRIERINNGTGFEVAYVPSADWTYIVVDGIPVHQRDYGLIGNIPVKAVKSAEIIKNSQTANKYFNEVFLCAPACSPPPFPAILAIYTYAGEGLFSVFTKTKSTNLMNDTAPQFTPIREYYNPEYNDSEKIDWGIPDRRTLLYWNPDIVTDRNGQAKITFFNSDLTGKMVLVCEGITPDGKVGYSEVTYEVDFR